MTSKPPGNTAPLAHRLRVLATGVSGRMGRQVVAAVRAAPDLELCGAVSRSFGGPTERGRDASVGSASALEAELRSAGVRTFSDLAEALGDLDPDVLVDFTSAEVAPGYLHSALSAGVPVVSGTTGLDETVLAGLRETAERMGLGAAIIPNFSLGAMVMAILARTAAPYFKAAEIVELHHDRKKDAPSGTALALARTVAASLGKQTPNEPESAAPLVAAGDERPPVREVKTAPTHAEARGLDVHGVPVHSVRLSGLVAHHELIFASDGETLTVRHDSVSRSSFMPGVLLAVRTVPRLTGLVTSLEELVNLARA
ncbi:MAG TPA: 4-hydroxy-tetrahydrodipicolinate reductase [Clostridiales bacterium]|nr:4-hydroxy-tetrahydrodipicolinate reductase [Clostridiales bacterium]